MTTTTGGCPCDGLQVFNELDTQDEADMMDLATFFQTLSGR